MDWWAGGLVEWIGGWVGLVGWCGLVDWWSGSLQLGAWKVCKSPLARATAMGRRSSIIIIIVIIIKIITVIIIMLIIMIIPTAPRIPPHRPPRTDKGRGVMSLVGYLLS